MIILSVVSKYYVKIHFPSLYQCLGSGLSFASCLGKLKIFMLCPFAAKHLPTSYLGHSTAAPTPAGKFT